MSEWRWRAWLAAVPVAAGAACAGYVAHPMLTLTAVTVAGVVAARYGARSWRWRRFRSTYTRPTLGALKPALGDAPVRLRVDPGLGQLVTRMARPMSPAETAVRAWYGGKVEPVVRWAPDRVQRGLWAAQRTAGPVLRRLEAFRRPRDDRQRIELRMAVPFLTAEQRQHISAVISAKVPAGDLVEAWDQVGRSVTATWTVRRRPPARVGYADLDARMGNLAEWEYFLGLGIGSKPVVVSLRDDSPHIALSAGSGAGKSVLAQLLAVQVLARGGAVVILDRKGSHRWALGRSGVDYCTRPEEMHHALIRLAKLADDRNAAALHEEEGWDPGPRVLVICEELNATIGQIRSWWDDNRPKGGPKTAPSIRALGEIAYMGRSAKVNLVAIAQMLTARAIGGGEARENFAIRCLSRYTVNAWKMLVPEAAMPRPSRTQGRWQIVVGGAATETQVCFLTAAEARMVVAKHRVPVSPADAGTPLMGASLQMSPGQGPDVPVDPLAELVTLRAAAERGIVPWKHAAAKKRLQRTTAGPEPAGRDGTANTYRVGDLIAWAESEMVS